MNELIEQLKSYIESLPDNDSKVEALNHIRYELHTVSPLKHHPVDCVQWAKSESVEVNDYNPNSVASPEMKLLYESIKNDGYTMPIVTFQEQKEGGSVTKVIDGFHRRLTERTNPDISESTLGYIPVTDVRKTQYDLGNRMASTIRHNRARGSHNIELMSTIVAELVEMGKGDRWICQHIGMSADELLRLKQITGLAALFTNKSFSKSWTAESEDDYEPEEA